MIRYLLLFILLFTSPLLVAAPLTWTIATDKTAIGLSWQAFGHSFSQAHLQGVTGTVILNSQDDRDDHIEVKIPLATLVASNALLTHQLKSDMFFAADRYPWIFFSSTRVVALGAGKFRIFGMLTVKDVRRPVVMEATLDAGEIDAAPELALHATTGISRSAFNVDRLVGIVDDHVDIALTIVAHRATAP